MSEKLSKSKLKLIYNDIIFGHSVIKDKYFGSFYIKHLNGFDSAEIDLKYESSFEAARQRDIPTEAEREEYILKEGYWTKEQEKKLSELTFYLKGLYTTKSKMWKQRDLARLSDEIKKAEKNKTDLETEKRNLIDYTAETYASKKVNEYYIFATLYKTSDLKEKLFDEKDFDELESEKLSQLVNLYNLKTQEFSEYNLKTVALSSFFSNLFYLSNDNVSELYGKPLIYLTFYQTQLAMFGKYFKNMLSDSQTRPPDNILEEPDKVIEWYDSSKNLKEVVEKSKKGEAAGTSYLGATKEDLKKAGIETPANKIDLMKEAAKKGGTLNMRDLMRLHGEK